MTWDEIKKILQEEGGKCVIIEENGSAYYVVEKRQGRNEPKEEPAVAEITEAEQENNHQAIEKANKDVAEFKTQEDEETDFSGLEESQDVKIEDLPF